MYLGPLKNRLVQSWDDVDDDTHDDRSESELGLVNDNNQVVDLYPLYLVLGMMPVFIVLLLPLLDIYMDRRRSLRRAVRLAETTNLAEPIRQAYLLNLMDDYSMILSKSDICDEHDCEDSDGGSSKGATIETCDDTLSSSERSDMDEPATKSKDKDSNYSDNDNYSENDNGDIELQMPKDNINSAEKKEEVNDSVYSECGSYGSCCHCTILVPPPGQKSKIAEWAKGEHETSKQKLPNCRAHSDGCAVCLAPFETGQRVTWSSNPECPHVFHHQCLLEWFVAVGTKAWVAETARQQILGTNDRDTRSVSEIKKQICDFQTPCPFCRQDYFLEGSLQAKDDTASTLVIPPGTDPDTEDGNSSNTEEGRDIEQGSASDHIVLPRF